MLILTHFTDYQTKAQELLSNIPKVITIKEGAKCNRKPTYRTLEPVLFEGGGLLKVFRDPFTPQIHNGLSLSNKL